MLLGQIFDLRLSTYAPKYMFNTSKLASLTERVRHKYIILSTNGEGLAIISQVKQQCREECREPFCALKVYITAHFATMRTLEERKQGCDLKDRLGLADAGFVGS